MEKTNKPPTEITIDTILDMLNNKEADFLPIGLNPPQIYIDHKDMRYYYRFDHKKILYVQYASFKN